MLPLLLTGDSKLNHVPAVYLSQKRLFHSSQPAAVVYKAGLWPLVTIQREFLWFKFLTQGFLGQACGTVGTSQILGFISASGTPQWYRSWLLCSLLLMHWPSCWQAEDERTEGDFSFWLGGLFDCAQLVNFPWAISEHPSNFNLRQAPDRARKPQWGFWRMQKPDAAGNHHVLPKESNTTS